MKKWEVLYQQKKQSPQLNIEDIIDILLQNRGIVDTKEREEFLHPKLAAVTVDSVGIDKDNLEKALKRIQEAIENKEQIVVYGDYDVDGICGTAILWETLYVLGASVVPYIPHRVDEGYGLSEKGIMNLQDQISNTKLIITVDNGIVANEAVDFAKSLTIDVIITDHHVSSEAPPDAHTIVHTTKLCGTGVAYLLAQEVLKRNSERIKDPQTLHDHLALVALATVADLVPLTESNRILLTYGLQELRKTTRPGLLALFQEAAINQHDISTYTIGHVIGPRLNAAGRLEYAMDSLRLLCTKDTKRAYDLALLLGKTNRDRQQLTIESVAHAKELIRTNAWEENKLFFVAHESYQQGVIGLIAGRITEEYYRPAIVLSIGEEYCKASARSVHGFNIIEFIRHASEHLINAGGHPMAAGFTVETAKLAFVQKLLEEKAQELLTDDMLVRSLTIDCELSLSLVNQELYDALQQLAPFGMKNSEPIFMSQDVKIDDIRIIGKDGRHMKLMVTDPQSHQRFEAIAFGFGDRFTELFVGDAIDIAYTIDENHWNGRKKLQLKVKDIRKH